MDYSDQQTLLIAYTISNVVGVLILGAAIKRPRLARLLFFFLFGWAAWFNYATCHQHPESYLMYAETAAPFYSSFITGWFSNHVTTMVTAIAFCQGLISVGMLLKGIWVKLACIGAIIFLMSIAPLGLYAAFPFSLTVSAAAFMILRRDKKNFLWVRSSSIMMT